MSVLPDTAAVEAGRLCVGGVALSELALAHGTPLHVYDEATLRNRARAYREALAGYPGPARAVYACKANATVALLRILLDEGMGMDVASEGELAHALAAGAPGERLVVHGNNKSDADVRAAVDAEAGLLVVDHVEELDQVERIAAAAGRGQPILLRVTPGIEAATHAKIRTAHASSKFGIAPADVAARGRAHRRVPAPAARRPARAPRLADPRSRHVPPGGGVAGRVPAERRAAAVLDLGGGLAIPYTDDDNAPDLRAAASATVAAVAERFDPPARARARARPLGCRHVRRHALHGRGREEAGGVTYVAVDGGMSDNPRPVLYGARYQAWIADRAGAEPDGDMRSQESTASLATS